MTLDIYPIVLHKDAFGAQTGTLFVAGCGTRGQAYLTASGNHPMPW